MKRPLFLSLMGLGLCTLCTMLTLALTTAYLFTRQPIYRATLKLLVTSPAGGAVTQDKQSFCATQIEILRGQVLLRRTQQRLKKSPAEIGENLSDLQVAVAGGADIINITVDSPAKGFAREFATALGDEYLKWHEEQRTNQEANTGFAALTRETNRLGQELKAANDRVSQYAKEHKLINDGDQQSLTVAELVAAAEQLGEALARKRLLDAFPDDASLSTFLAGQPATGTMLGPDAEKLSDVIREKQSPVSKTNAIQQLRRKVEAGAELARQRFEELKVLAKDVVPPAVPYNPALAQLRVLQEDANRIRKIYNALLGQLLKLDVETTMRSRQVSILEPAIVEPYPVYPKKIKGLSIAVAWGMSLGLVLTAIVAVFTGRRDAQRPPPLPESRAD